MDEKHVVAGLLTLSLALAHAYLMPQGRVAVGSPAWLTAVASVGQSLRGPFGGGIYDRRASSTLHAPGPATNR